MMMRTPHPVMGDTQRRSAREPGLVKSTGLTGLAQSNPPDYNRKKKEPGKGIPGIKIFTIHIDSLDKNIYRITVIVCFIELEIT